MTPPIMTSFSQHWSSNHIIHTMVKDWSRLNHDHSLEDPDNYANYG